MSSRNHHKSSSTSTTNMTLNKLSSSPGNNIARASISDRSNQQQPTKKLPHNNKFQQQKLPIWAPHWSLNWTLSTLVGIALIFLPCGIAFLVASRNVIVAEQRYDNLVQCQTLNATCVVPIIIPEHMNAPVYFYYKVSGFFQNHRRYVKSVDFRQMGGDDITSDCEPLEKYGDAFNGATNVNLREKTLYPCGLIASSLFRDEYTACVEPRGSSTCNVLDNNNWDKYSTAWSSDRDRRYDYRPPTDRPASWTDMSPAQGGFTMPPINDEKFMIWMRTASFSTFTKLYRIIHDQDIPQYATLKITVDNQFNTREFGGKKYIVVATSSYMGTRNDFLGIAFIVTACMLLAVATIFVLRDMAWSSSEEEHSILH